MTLRRRSHVTPGRLWILRGTFFLLAFAGSVATPVRAADFSVSPMVVEFERGVRSSEIQVRNLDQQPIRFQVRGTDWSQDETGKNLYADSKSLIWFPRALELAPGESRIIRVGVRATPSTKEEAYVLFLQEVALDSEDAQKARGAQVRLLLSISVPIYVPPVDPKPGGEIESFELRHGTLDVVVGNAGNKHFSYREATVVGASRDGKEKLRQVVRGRTLLSGSRQRFEIVIPPAICGELKELSVGLTTLEPSDIKRRLDVVQADCE